MCYITTIFLKVLNRTSEKKQNSPQKKFFGLTTFLSDFNCSPQGLWKKQSSLQIQISFGGVGNSGGGVIAIVIVINIIINLRWHETVEWWNGKG